MSHWFHHNITRLSADPLGIMPRFILDFLCNMNDIYSIPGKGGKQ